MCHAQSDVTPPAEDASPLALVAYRVGSTLAMPIEPASSNRRWMDATTQRFANRCLPLLIANQSGWVLLSAHRIRATWTGAADLGSLMIELLSGAAPCPAVSHFGHGILTWHIPYLFRTPPGYNLLVRGPANRPKDGIHPLEGVVESDWSEATFTMNWQLTRPVHRVTFEVGEPIAMLVPQRRGELERFQPEIRDIAGEPALGAAYEQWAAERAEFNAALYASGSEARRRGWQKDYFRGRRDGRDAFADHQTKLGLGAFEEHEGTGEHTN